MRKFFVLIFALAATIGLCSLQYTNLCMLDVGGRYICYSRDNTTFIPVDMDEAVEEYCRADAPYGECIILYSADDFEYVKRTLMLRQVSSDMYGQTKIEYYYSPRLKEKIDIRGKSVNITVAYGENVKIGYPIIRDSC